MSLKHSEPFIFVNNKRHALDRVDPFQSLGSFLNDLDLMGARKIDDQNLSGADTVTLVKFETEKASPRYLSIPAYEVPLVAVVGQQVITVEGIGSVEAMNPIQRRFYQCESFQCGYCAGGFVMSMYSLLRENQKPTCADIEDALNGNFCRCTGYRPISAAAFGYAVDAPKEITMGDPNWKFDESQKFDITKELVVPEQIVKASESDYKFKRFVDDPTRGITMRGIEVPGSLVSLRNIMASIPDTIIVSPGNEGIMISEHLTKDRSGDHYTLTHRVQELSKIEVLESKGSGDGTKCFPLSIGVNATIQSFIDFSSSIKNEVLKQIRDILKTIPKALRVYKSFNSILLNPCFKDLLSVLTPTTEPKDDVLAPTVYAVPEQGSVFIGVRRVADSSANGFVVSSVNTVSKTVSVTCSLVVKNPQKTFKHETVGKCYRDANWDVENIESLTASLIAMFEDHSMLKYKGLMKHSIVIAAMESGEFETTPALEKLAKWVPFNEGPPVTTRSFPMLDDMVRDKKEGVEQWDKYVGKIPAPSHKLHTKYVHREILQQNGKEKVTGVIRFPIDKPRLYNEVLHAFPVLTTVPCGSVIDIDLSEAKKVAGYFEFYSAADLPEDSPNSFSGIPPNDTPVFVNKNGRVLHCDQIIGVVVASNNETAILCSKLVKVTYDTDMDSERNIAFKHKPDVPRNTTDKAGDDNTSVEGCFTIKQAMAKDSYHPYCGVDERVVTLGLNPLKSPENINNKDLARDAELDKHEPDRDTDAPIDPVKSKEMITEIIDKCDVKIEGEMTIGGQEHFYAEPFTATVVPTTNDTYLVHVSSQNVSKIQADIARNMCIPSSKIVTQADNIGGGYGGKQDRPQIVAVPCAVASVLSKRAVTMTLTRDVDMRITGGRHGYVYQYRAGFSKDGKYEALDATLITDGGGTFDVTAAVLDKSIFQNTSVYTIPKIRIEGRAVRTNRPTNTAYRGFGAPQTTQLCENVIDHAAQVLGMDPTELRKKNANKPGDKLITGTYTGSTKGCDIPERLFKNIEGMSDYEARRKQIDEFNKDPTNKYLKRGIAIIPIKNSVCFEEDFMNQAHALVHVYADGTVRVAHSGVEMGQGLHTKMRMVAAESLRVELDRVFVGPTATDTCANTQPTSASSGTDINAPAVRKACETIRERLEAVRDSMGSKDESMNEDGTPNPNAPIESHWGKAGFSGAVITAYFTRVNLSEHVYHTLPHLQWNWPAKFGYTGFYTAYGICCSEVELNGFTGEYKVIRTDLIEDVGNTLNPSLDSGQVEGGFTQGYGWVCTEELCYDSEGQNPTGTLLNSSLSEYNVPMLNTVPNVLNTSLIDGTGDPMSAYGAKASSEAPVCLASGVHYAIRDAVRAYRSEMGKTGNVLIPAPSVPSTVSQFLE